MSIRIRYETTSDPNVVRSKNFTVGDKTLFVLLNKHSMSYYVYDLNTEQLVTSGGGTRSYVNLLRKTREALEKLGANVTKEQRKPYVRKSDGV